MEKTSPSSGVNLVNFVADGVSLKGGSITSDMNLKDVTTYITDLTIDKIAKAPLFNFKWKDNPNGLTHVGTSAQYWQETLPNVVMRINGNLSLDYNGVLIASVISTARKVVDHELRIKQLEEENRELREEIKLLKAA